MIPNEDCPLCGRPAMLLKWEIDTWRVYHAPGNPGVCDITRRQAHELLEGKSHA